MGSASADTDPGLSLIDTHEGPDPIEHRAQAALRELAMRSQFAATPAGHGWRLVVPVRVERTQAVYLGFAGCDADERAILSLASVVGPANHRDLRHLLMLNARVVEGHFAIKVLRGEEYFVVMHNLAADTVANTDAARLVRRVAETADQLEDRLSRGQDLY